MGEKKPLGDKIKKAIELCKYTDWGYDGENEYPISCLDEELLIEEIELILKDESIKGS